MLDHSYSVGDRSSEKEVDMMKTQMKYLFAIACFQIGMFIVTTTMTPSGTYVFPGPEYSRPLNSTDTEEYLEQFNATETISKWTPQSDILTFIGGSLSAISLFFQTFSFIWLGFGSLLWTLAGTIPLESLSVLTALFGGLVVLHWIMVVTLIFEVIFGRQMLD